MILAPLIPQGLHRIQLWRIGWQFEQAQVRRLHKFLALMPTRTVQHHHDPFAGIPQGDLIKKQLHAVAIDVGHDQCVQLSVRHRDRRIGLGICLRDHRLDPRSNGFRTPTPTRIGEASEPRFVLKHQVERSFRLPLPVDFREGIWAFFFPASCVGTSA